MFALLALFLVFRDRPQAPAVVDRFLRRWFWFRLRWWFGLRLRFWLCLRWIFGLFRLRRRPFKVDAGDRKAVFL